MDIDQTKLIDKYERLFAEEGWKELVSDFQDRQRLLKEMLLQDGSADAKTLYLAQGQNSVYSYLIGLESTVESVKQAQAEEASLPEVGAYAHE